MIEKNVYKLLDILIHYYSINLYNTININIFQLCFVYLTFVVETYLSPVETHCMNIDYFIPDEENQTRGFSDDAMARLRKYNTNK